MCADFVEEFENKVYGALLNLCRDEGYCCKENKSSSSSEIFTAQKIVADGQSVFSGNKSSAGTKNPLEKLRIGIGVSGGADSVSLLTALNSLSRKYNFSIFVISVNHFIRPDKETCGDAEFVKKLCSLDFLNVDFTLVELEHGEVDSCAEKRRMGIEEAARFLRYEAFEKFINDKNLDYLCLAHNQNDLAETLLMRFLQGSGVEGKGGICARRGKFIRPLLGVSRAEIEKYLTEKNIFWRTDSTNYETEYLRNKIRLKLMPFLDENFPGWKNGVLKGGKKAEEEKEVLSEIGKEAYKLCVESYKKGEYCVQLEAFNKQKDAIKKRIIFQIFNQMYEENGFVTKRIPSPFLEDLLWEADRRKSFTKIYEHILAVGDGEKLLFKKNCKTQTEVLFFDIIEEDGCYDFPFGELNVKKICENQVELSCGEEGILLKVNMPFCIRNFAAGDLIKTKDGEYKKIIDIFSDWKVNEESRMLLPLVQELESENQEIICIFGKPLGFNNWIVNEKVCN